MILCGDLNGRTSNRFPDTSSIINSQHAPYTHVETGPISRRSENKTLNSYGKELLNMRVALDLWIMNYVCNGDPQGRYTYISDTGNSVNDYFLVTDDLFALVQRCCQLHVSERIESDHLPLEFDFDLAGCVDVGEEKADLNLFIEKNCME